MRNGFAPITAGLILLASTASADMTPSFQGLGILPGGNNSRAYGVSGDGATVVGSSQSTPGTHGFRWTADEGMIGLGDLPGGGYCGRAQRISADGSAIIGYGYGVDYHAFRWTEPEGMVDLGSLSGPSEQSGAYGVSADGSVVVGYSQTDSFNAPFRWTAKEGMQPLEGVVRGGASDVSADGTVIVGSRGGSLAQAFRWTEETGPVDLGDLPGGNYNSYAKAISADGQVIVGYGSSAYCNDEAYRWSESGGMVGLGFLWTYEGLGASQATDTNGDGSIVVGYGVTDLYGTRAPFIWDEKHGMRAFQDVLENDYNLDMSGWNLLEATGISDDGSTIVGFGYGPAGRLEGWIARIPEPGSL